MIYDFLIKFLPAMIANSSPVVYFKLPFNQPINQEIFGKNKTWKGFLLGTLSGSLVAYVISVYYPVITLNAGVLMSFGALFGDLIKSYFKRRLGKKEGDAWLPFDQVDWILGAMLFSFYAFSITEIIIILATIPFLHIFTNKVAYWAKLKDTDS